MNTQSITFPKHLADKLPENIKKMDVRAPVTSTPSKTSGIVALAIGISLLTLFGASVACHLGPGVAIPSGVLGTVVTGGSIVPLVSSPTVSTARKIQIYDYLISKEKKRAAQTVLSQAKRAEALLPEQLKKGRQSRTEYQLNGLNNRGTRKSSMDGVTDQLLNILERRRKA